MSLWWLKLRAELAPLLVTQKAWSEQTSMHTCGLEAPYVYYERGETRDMSQQLDPLQHTIYSLRFQVQAEVSASHTKNIWSRKGCLATLTLEVDLTDKEGYYRGYGKVKLISIDSLKEIE